MKKIFYIGLFVLIFPINIQAANYCPAKEASDSKVKTSVSTTGKLVVEYYDFFQRHGNNGHSVEFGVASAVTACYSRDAYDEGFNVSNIQNGQDLLIYGKASSSKCLTKNEDDECTLSWYMYKSNEFPSSASVNYDDLMKYQEPNTVSHVHYKRLVMDGSIVCPKPSDIQYVTLGTGKNIWDYHSIGCTPKCDYSKCACKTYNPNYACGCTAYNCQIPYGPGDAINDTTCSTIVDTTKSDNTKRLYSLSGTNVETGVSVNAVCDSNGNCQF